MARVGRLDAVKCPKPPCRAIAKSTRYHPYSLLLGLLSQSPRDHCKSGAFHIVGLLPDLARSATADLLLVDLEGITVLHIELNHTYKYFRP